MFPGRCASLGGSRRLSLHSTAALPSFGAHFAPCRTPYPAQICDCFANEAGAVQPAGRPSAACRSPPSTARAAVAHAAPGPGLDAPSCTSAPVSTTNPALPKIDCSSINNNSSCGGIAGSSKGDGGGTCAATVTSAVAVGVQVEVVGAGPGPGSLVEDTTADSWLTPLRRPGSVVALGKFDALHRGHRALAAEAAALAREVHAGRSAAGGGAGAGGASVGDAVLLSFSGMAAVLGWPDRLPLTAPQDRGRVLAGWAAACAANGNGDGADADAGQSPDAGASGAAPPPPPPRLRTLPFALIRSMAPEQFVALLARDLGAAGVVAGRNYRFGYKAAGDADTLVRLGRQYGMRVEIVDLVTLPDQPPTANPTVMTSTYGPIVSGGASSSVDGGFATASAPPAAHGGPPAAAGGSPAAAVVYDGASSMSMGSMDGPGAAAGDGRGGGGGSGGRRGGGAVAAGASSRVSSSRIRELLEQGRVECVEQLLGRKYRLVCDLAAAGIIQSNGWNSSKSSGSSGADGDSRADGESTSSSGSTTPCGEASGLVLPRAAYQNQAPANGQYRALVQLVAGGSQVLVGDGVAGGGMVDGAPEVRNVDGRVGMGDDDAALMSGGVCVMVELNDSGLEVALSEATLQGLARVGDGGLLLVDFDACG